jgi:hypothetical protein
MSLDDDPTWTANSPFCLAQSCALVSQMDKSRSVSEKVTVVFAPGGQAQKCTQRIT